MICSQLPGFFQLSIQERRRLVLAELSADPFDDDADDVLNSGGLSVETADQIVENVVGIYALPMGVALYAHINGEDRLIPMVVEEPSVIAAASNACKMIRAGGGFEATMRESLMIAQIELRHVADLDSARAALEGAEQELLQMARSTLRGLVRRGGGPTGLHIRTIGPDHLVVHLLVDCCDAMGANLCNSAAEALGPRLAELAQADLGLRILSNLTDRRLVEIRAEIPVASIVGKLAPGTGMLIAQGIEAASIFAERDPYRAATHNKGIMNGVDSVVLATGNDYRAVEAGAHAFACQNGRYSPLSTWRLAGERLVGSLTMPLAVGVVGGTLRVHPGARLALRLCSAKGATDLALLAGCAGLASNLAALRALATEGIQRGHMSLQARAVATLAGAVGIEVQVVAQIISQAGDVSVEAAKEALKNLQHPPAAV